MFTDLEMWQKVASRYTLFLLKPNGHHISCCPKCSIQWSLLQCPKVPSSPHWHCSALGMPVVLNAVPNGPYCSGQRSLLTAVPMVTSCPLCSAQWSQLQCPIAHHLHCPMLQFEVPYGPNCSAKPSAVPNGTMASVVHIRVTLGHLRVTIAKAKKKANTRQTQLSFTPK